MRDAVVTRILAATWGLPVWWCWSCLFAEELWKRTVSRCESRSVGGFVRFGGRDAKTRKRMGKKTKIPRSGQRVSESEGYAQRMARMQLPPQDYKRDQEVRQRFGMGKGQKGETGEVESGDGVTKKQGRTRPSSGLGTPPSPNEQPLETRMLEPAAGFSPLAAGLSWHLKGWGHVSDWLGPSRRGARRMRYPGTCRCGRHGAEGAAIGAPTRGMVLATPACHRHLVSGQGSGAESSVAQAHSSAGLVRTGRMLCDGHEEVECQMGWRQDRENCFHPDCPLPFSLPLAAGVDIEVETAQQPRAGSDYFGVLTPPAITSNVMSSPLFWPQGSPRVREISSPSPSPSPSPSRSHRSVGTSAVAGPARHCVTPTVIDPALVECGLRPPIGVVPWKAALDVLGVLGKMLGWGNKTLPRRATAGQRHGMLGAGPTLRLHSPRPHSESRALIAQSGPPISLEGASSKAAHHPSTLDLEMRPCCRGGDRCASSKRDPPGLNSVFCPPLIRPMGDVLAS